MPLISSMSSIRKILRLHGTYIQLSYFVPKAVKKEEYQLKMMSKNSFFVCEAPLCPHPF